MPSETNDEKIVQVKVPITWDLVCRHRIYSCPDTPRFDFVKDASSLLLDAGFRNQICHMRVVGVWNLDPNRPAAFDSVPTDWRNRLNAYVDEASHLAGILDQGGNYRFYGLAKNADDDCEGELCTRTQDDSWPVWLKAMVNKRDLDVQAALAIWRDKKLFFRWPRKARLLWLGLTRHPNGCRQDCYEYPENVTAQLEKKRLKPDGRNNGPAILAFLMENGERPAGWHIHHVYDGNVLIPGTQTPILHAVRHGGYFTHSGGLVAAHPAAHYVAHQSELLGWLLKWEAFRRFKFDPDAIFENGE